MFIKDKPQITYTGESWFEKLKVKSTNFGRFRVILSANASIPSSVTLSLLTIIQYFEK